jgi:uncharacterized protein YjaG (DUF416 family)
MKTCVTHFACDCLEEKIKTLESRCTKLEEAIGVAEKSLTSISAYTFELSGAFPSDEANEASQALTRIKAITAPEREGG